MRRRGSCWRALAAAALAAFAADGATVREVRIENRGAVPADTSAVRVLVSVRAGDPFEAAQVARDVQRLRESERYALVDAEVVPVGEDVILVYGVTAKPRLARLRVYGAERFSLSRLRELLDLDIGAMVDEGDLAAAAGRVRNAYLRTGYPDVAVEVEMELDEDAGTADVQVYVTEGPRGRVRRIAFEGNRAIPDAELRRGLLQRRYRWYVPWHWFGRTGRLDETLLAEDRFTVRTRYLDEGYLDARVGEPRPEPDARGRIRVVLPVEEGERYTLGQVAVEGVAAYPREEVRAVVGLEPGGIASRREIERAAEAIMAFYGDRGHLGTGVQPMLVPSEPGVVDAIFRVEERPRARIRDVRVAGNVVTRDRVIRRELLIRPGDDYHRGRIRASESRLLNLGFFSAAQALIEPSPEPGAYDLVFEVEEAQVGQASVGLGFSSIDQITGFLEVSHGNFDLTAWPPVGGGQKVRFRLAAGTRRTDAELSFTEPYFLGRRLSLGVDLHHRELQFLSRYYDQRETGGRVALTRPIGPFSRATIAYGLDRYNIFNLADDAGAILREEEGVRFKSATTLTVSRDTRDRTLIPTRGHRLSLSTSVAGSVLGGDTDIYRIDARAVQYVPLWFGHVLSFRAESGVVDTHSGAARVPLFDRYFLGGAYTLRAFDFRDVGPRDEDERSIGGRTMAFGAVEYTVPVIDGVRLAAFLDAGMVWEDAYRIDRGLNSGYGLGVRFDIPMLPLRFDYAWPWQADPENDRPSGRFSFSIGHGF